MSDNIDETKLEEIATQSQKLIEGFNPTPEERIFVDNLCRQLYDSAFKSFAVFQNSLPSRIRASIVPLALAMAFAASNGVARQIDSDIIPTSDR